MLCMTDKASLMGNSKQSTLAIRRTSLLSSACRSKIEVPVMTAAALSALLLQYTKQGLRWWKCHPLQSCTKGLPKLALSNTSSSGLLDIWQACKFLIAYLHAPGVAALQQLRQTSLVKMSGKGQPRAEVQLVRGGGRNSVMPSARCNTPSCCLQFFVCHLNLVLSHVSQERIALRWAHIVLTQKQIVW